MPVMANHIATITRDSMSKSISSSFPLLISLFNRYDFGNGDENDEEVVQGFEYFLNLQHK